MQTTNGVAVAVAVPVFFTPITQPRSVGAESVMKVSELLVRPPPPVGTPDGQSTWA